jgi:hypothetical protein
MSNPDDTAYAECKRWLPNGHRPALDTLSRLITPEYIQDIMFTLLQWQWKHNRRIMKTTTRWRETDLYLREAIAILENSEAKWRARAKAFRGEI